MSIFPISSFTEASVHLYFTSTTQQSFPAQISADGTGILSIFIIKILTVSVISIHLGERVLPFTVVSFFFFFLISTFLPAALSFEKAGRGGYSDEGDYFDGIPACVIY